MQMQLMGQAGPERGFKVDIHQGRFKMGGDRGSCSPSPSRSPCPSLRCLNGLSVCLSLLTPLSFSSFVFSPPCLPALSSALQLHSLYFPFFLCLSLPPSLSLFLLFKPSLSFPFPLTVFSPFPTHYSFFFAPSPSISQNNMQKPFTPDFLPTFSHKEQIKRMSPTSTNHCVSIDPLLLGEGRTNF